MATVLTNKEKRKYSKKIKELNKELMKVKLERQREIELSEETRAVCQRLADDPSVNAARREQWKKSAQDAESLLKYSMRKQESIEEERDELVALLVGGERPRKKAVRSLKESCMSVVTTAVVHQKANPDKLFAKLPDYIPSRLRRAITDRFQVYAKYIL